jgi:putative transposase
MGLGLPSRPANLRLVLGERGRRVRFVVRDRDAKFTRAFDDVFGSDDAEVLITPVQAPNANAYAERWIHRVRAECLDWLLITGRGHLEQVLRSYVEHDNGHRPTRRSNWSRPIHRSVQSSSATTSAGYSDATGSTACPTSTTDKLHERDSAPYGP